MTPICEQAQRKALSPTASVRDDQIHALMRQLFFQHESRPVRHKASLAGIQRAAAASVAASYNRQRNLRAFADQFLARIPQSEGERAHSVLQQVRLSV